MNWSKNSSIELSRACVILFMVLLAALDIACYWAVGWFVRLRLMDRDYIFFMMTKPPFQDYFLKSSDYSIQT